MNIDEIKAAINQDRVVLSRHSLDEALADNITIEEVYLSVIETGEIIEDYSDAYPLPACLVLGWNRIGEAIHSVWAYNYNTQIAKLITVYRPDPELWFNWRIRR